MATNAKSSSLSKPRTSRNNPHKVNQYTGPDPRQSLFLASFLDPKSPTFSNALQSGLKAGYSQEYSESLVAQMPLWLSEKLGELDMLKKAERNLNKILELETNLPVMGMFGPVYDRIPDGVDKNGKEKFRRGELVKAENSKLLAIQADVTKFVSERLGRTKYGPKESPTNTFISLNFFDENQLRKVAARTIDGDSTSAPQLN